MLGDAELLELLEGRRSELLAKDEGTLTEIIRRSLMVKGRIVSADLRESGLRAHLNLGHTFAHALEALGSFSGWSHGEAVAWGLLRALELGERLGETDPAYRQRMEALLRLYEYRLVVEDLPPKELLAAMKKDKKRRGGRVRFVLQRRLCETFQREVDDEILLALLEEGQGGRD